MAIPHLKSILPILPVLSAGINFVKARSQEDDYRKGVNVLFASTTLSSQWSSVCIVAVKILEQFPANGFTKGLKIGLQVVPLVNFFAMPFLGIIHATLYPDFFQVMTCTQKLAAACDNALRTSQSLNIAQRISCRFTRALGPIAALFPKTLSPLTIKTACFLSQHLGNLAEVAIVIEALALIKFNQKLYTATLLVPLIYYRLSSVGLIPSLMQRLQEYLFPPVVYNALIQAGNLFSKILPIQINAFFSFMNQVNLIKVFIECKLDQFLRQNFIFPHSPTLADLYAPFSSLEQTNLSFEQIDTLFDQNTELEINFAHCCKGADNWICEKNRDFDKFQTLFDQQTWNDRVVRLKCLDDARFRLHLAELIGKKDQLLTPNYDNYLEMAAADSKQTEKTFVMQWFKERCEKWLEMLKEATSQDDQLRQAISRLAGYMIKHPEKSETILLQLVVGKNLVSAISTMSDYDGMVSYQRELEKALRSQHLKRLAEKQKEGPEEDRIRTKAIVLDLVKRLSESSVADASLMVDTTVSLSVQFNSLINEFKCSQQFNNEVTQFLELLKETPHAGANETLKKFFEKSQILLGYLLKNKDKAEPILKKLIPEIAEVSYSYSPALEVLDLSLEQIGLSLLPSDTSFQELLTQWLTTLENNYETVKEGVVNDARFITYLSRKLPHLKDIRPNYEHALAKAVAAAQMNEQPFIMNWFKAQMPLFVAKIKHGAISVMKTSDLGHAVENSEKILPLLLKMHTAKKPVVNDYLLQLAVEAGGYCDLGVKRATEVVLTDLITTQCTTSLSAEEKSETFKLSVYLALQEDRLERIDGFVANLTTCLKLPNTIGHDIHSTNFIKKVISLGFIPIRQSELAQYGLWSYFYWWVFQRIALLNNEFYHHYETSMSQVLKSKKISLDARTEYILMSLNQNPNLNPAQKADLQTKIAEAMGEEAEDVQRRLSLVFLGILKFKTPTLRTKL
jgi:hypothetical protein